MIELLTNHPRDVLRPLGAAHTLLAFDFDGTLAPILADRDAVELRCESALLLLKICQLYPCAVISGRQLADVTQRLQGASVKYIIGNHGLEPGIGIEAFVEAMASARKILAQALQALAGVDIEDKRYSLAIHYRQSPQKKVAQATIFRAISQLPLPVRTIAGKFVVNVVPMQAPNKGDALRGLAQREGAKQVLYVGDDVTDEDVFAHQAIGNVLAIRVGQAQHSAAPYFLRHQEQIDNLLALLIELREELHEDNDDVDRLAP